MSRASKEFKRQRETSARKPLTPKQRWGHLVGKNVIAHCNDGTRLKAKLLEIQEIKEDLVFIKLSKGSAYYRNKGLAGNEGADAVAQSFTSIVEDKS